MVRAASYAIILIIAFGQVLISVIAFVPFTSDGLVTYASLSTRKNGWFDNLFPQLNDAEAEKARREKFPEQYPATYEMSNFKVPTDGSDAALLRPLLKQTQLEERPLEIVYDASKHGWTPQSFHSRVDGKGCALVVATGKTNEGYITVGGYNPKGWSSLGGARPSVAAFLFYSYGNEPYQKLHKVGGGGLACARDDPNYGISFGPDALVIGLQPGRERLSASKLGPYYEKGPEERSSLFGEAGGAIQLDSLKVFVGKYEPGEEIPYSGAVMNMTSG
jgi:TLD